MSLWVLIICLKDAVIIMLALTCFRRHRIVLLQYPGATGHWLFVWGEPVKCGFDKSFKSWVFHISMTRANDSSKYTAMEEKHTVQSIFFRRLFATLTSQLVYYVCRYPFKVWCTTRMLMTVQTHKQRHSIILTLKQEVLSSNKKK